MQYLQDNPTEGWQAEHVEQAFRVKPMEAQRMAEQGPEDRRHLSREVLLFSRAEVNEEVLQSADYGRTQARLNYYVRVDTVEGPRQTKKSYVCYLHHFLRIPHPDCNLDSLAALPPLRLAMATFYNIGTPLAGDPPRMVRVETAKTNGKYYAISPATIKYKYVVAFTEGRGNDKRLCCTTYHGLTGSR